MRTGKRNIPRCTIYLVLTINCLTVSSLYYTITRTIHTHTSFRPGRGSSDSPAAYHFLRPGSLYFCSEVFRASFEYDRLL